MYCHILLNYLVLYFGQLVTQCVIFTYFHANSRIFSRDFRTRTRRNKYFIGRQEITIVSEARLLSQQLVRKIQEINENLN